MKKVLYGLLILFALVLIISYPFVLIGLLVSIWGINKIYKAKQLGAKSKSGMAILMIGVLLFISGIGSGETADSIDGAKEETAVEETQAMDEDEKEESPDREEKTSAKNKETDKENEDDATLETQDTQVVEVPKENNTTPSSSESSSSSKQQVAAELGLELVTVFRVIDGDTFELNDGRKVRLIGVNTPESTNRTEVFGKEASNYTKSKLEGKQIYLQKDVSDTDRYGRYLRLAWLDVPSSLDSESEIRSKMFNADLVLNGYAEPATYPPDVRYSEYFRKFAREAREGEKGLWAFGEEGTTKGDFDKTTATSSSNSGNEKSNNSSSSQWNGSTSGQKESFKNCTELRKVYPQGVPKDHPAYAPKHDRDKDGWACEV